MELKTKKILNKKNLETTVVWYNEKWMTLRHLSILPEFRKNDLDVKLLRERHKRGCDSIEQLMAPRGKTNSFKSQKIKEEALKLTDKTIKYIGNHYDMRPGEIFFRYISYEGFQDLKKYPFWKSQRICKDQENGKHAMFIKRKEMIEKGWIIV
jgi:hypothetical protein